jgi:hypothetical protein
MTKEKQLLYQDTDELRRILTQALKGRRFKLDCGHHVSFVFGFLCNDITIYNGKELKIICSQCGY